MSLRVARVFVTILLFSIWLGVCPRARKAKKKRLAVLELIGGIGRTLDEIGPEKVGFIRFRGEYWKACSDTIIKPNRRVKILAKEGPTLIVELIEEEVIAGKPEKSKQSRR